MKTVKANAEPLPPENIVRRTYYIVLARLVGSGDWYVVTGLGLWRTREAAENDARNLEPKWRDPVVVEIPGEA